MEALEYMIEAEMKSFGSSFDSTFSSIRYRQAMSIVLLHESQMGEFPPLCIKHYWASEFSDEVAVWAYLL